MAGLSDPRSRSVVRLRGGSDGEGVVYRLGRLVRTLAYVPVGQLADRVGYVLRTRYYRTFLWGLGEVVVGGAVDRQPSGIKPPLIGRGNAAVGEKIAAGTWPLVGVEITLPLRRSGMDWLPNRGSALWVFTLHYFEWLADLREAGAREAAQHLLRDWLEQYDQRWHPVAWHPYPLSLRVVSWLNHADWLLVEAEPELVEAFWSSLRRQVAHLSKNTETWLGGNHLIKNLRALITAGCCLQTCQRELRQGMAGLFRELAVQVHPDGGHYEASPSYHVQVLEDLVALALLLRRHSGVAEPLVKAIRNMARALHVMRQPDGTLGLFNDGALGEVRRINAVLEKAYEIAGDLDEDQLPEVLPDTGYARLSRGEKLAQVTLLADVGKIGPDENPGHAHADTLSFELSLALVGGGCERIVVNGGTYAYQDRQRNVFRGTPAHSTVSVDGQNSAEVWAGFRVGRRPVDVGFDLKNPAGGDAVLAGWHDGYRYLGLEHRRQWLLAADGSRLRGQDDLLPLGTTKWGGGWRKRRMVAHFPLHPAIKVLLPDQQQARLQLPSGREVVFKVLDGGRLMVREGWYAPQFGEKHGTQVLVILITPPVRGEPRAQAGWEFDFTGGTPPRQAPKHKKG